MRKITTIRSGFVLIENFFDDEAIAFWLQYILSKGEDIHRGFHHPDVKPNRFHKKPKYPVKKYMCFGLYWNPVDYLYYPEIPESNVPSFPIPDFFQDFCREALSYFPYKVNGYYAEAVMVNFYTSDSSMGLHVDKDEEDQLSPIIGVNFGSTCRFLFEDEIGEIREVKIPGNSVYVFGDEARLMKHGVGTIYANTVPLGQGTFFNSKERLNLTFRKVFK
jgi:alkylated DNA repair dioxygenase AlkB